MSLKKTACLASLLLTVPLAAPMLSVAADFDEHKDIEKTEGDAISGTKDEPQEEAPATGTYDKIYIGHAERQGTAEGKAEASYNTGIFKNDITLNASGKIYGGSATNSDKTSKESVDMTLEANWNTIILNKNGSITTNSTSNSNSQIYGGYAVSYSTKSGSAEASHNTITIEEGARLIENGRPKDSSGNEYIRV